MILGALWESLGAPFSEKNVFGSRSDFRLIFESLLGEAGGRGGTPLSLHNMQELSKKYHHARYPKGGGES